MSDQRDRANEIEDLLHLHYRCFRNMFDGNTCNMASYGTIMSYNLVQQAFEENPELDWVSAVEVWKHDAYLSPIIGTLYRWVERLMEKKPC